MLRKIEGRRRREWQRMGWLDGITDSVDMSLSKYWEMVKEREVRWATVHGVAKQVGYSPQGCKDVDVTERLAPTPPGRRAG